MRIRQLQRTIREQIRMIAPAAASLKLSNLAKRKSPERNSKVSIIVSIFRTGCRIILQEKKHII
jgi:hypothetical protein